MNSKVVKIKESDVCTLYSIQFECDSETVFGKFLSEFVENATFNNDFSIILTSLQRVMDKGALERYFRTEGKMSDRVFALPIDKCSLRLYCLRLSDSVLIIGGGGAKKTATYQEDEKLAGYVVTLQKLDSLITSFEKSGEIKIVKGDIVGINDKTFDI